MGGEVKLVLGEIKATWAVLCTGSRASNILEILIYDKNFGLRHFTYWGKIAGHLQKSSFNADTSHYHQA